MFSAVISVQIAPVSIDELDSSTQIPSCCAGQETFTDPESAAIVADGAAARAMKLSNVASGDPALFWNVTMPTLPLTRLVPHDVETMFVSRLLPSLKVIGSPV